MDTQQCFAITVQYTVCMNALVYGLYESCSENEHLTLLMLMYSTLVFLQVLAAQTRSHHK